MEPLHTGHIWQLPGPMQALTISIYGWPSTHITLAYINLYSYKTFLTYMKCMQSAKAKHFKYMVRKSMQSVKPPVLTCLVLCAHLF
jgi:hypothetical protein